MSELIQMNQGAIDALVKEAYERGLAANAWELGRAREAWDNRAIECEKLHYKVSCLQLDLEATKKYAAECHDALEPAQAKIKCLTESVNELRRALLQHVKETM